MLPTLPELFIIESLHPDDEGNGRFEGGILKSVLSFQRKNCEYTYVRTRKQLGAALRKFERSNFRYLHLSCHANEDGIATTNDDDIPIDDFSDLVGGALKGRRLFVSACSLVHRGFAKTILGKNEGLSVIGPNEDVYSSRAAIFWPALYHQLFEFDRHAIKHKQLQECVARTAKMFQVEMSYYSRSARMVDGVSVNHVTPAQLARAKI